MTEPKVSLIVVSHPDDEILGCGATGAKLAARGEIEPDERVVVYITGEGLKTIDCARGTFSLTEIAPRLEEFEAVREREGAPA